LPKRATAGLGLHWRGGGRLPEGGVGCKMRRRRAGSCWAAALFGVLTVGTAWVRSEQNEETCSPFQDRHWDVDTDTVSCGGKHMEAWQLSPAANASNRLDFHFRFGSEYGFPG